MEEHPVRLVLVDLSHSIGLAERSLWELAMRLPRERYAVRIWLSADEGASGLAEALEQHGFEVERFDESGRWNLRTPFHLWLRLRRLRPQLVHVHDSGAPGSLRVARSAIADGVPVLITRHGEGAPANEPEVRRIYARADVVTAPTRSEVEDLAGTLGIGRDRLRWVPYGAELPDDEFELPLARAWRERLGARPTRPLWVCPLRLEAGRGHEMLLDALALARGRGLGFLAAFGGDGALRPDLERRVAALGLERHVTFLDPLEAPGPLLAAADAVVIPSRDGPLPLVLLDALARERPVAASALPAVADVMEDGVHGRLFEPGDAAALAAVLEGFHRRPDAALRLGRAGAARVRGAFAWPGFVAAFEDAYDEILGLASFAPAPASR